MRIEKCSICDKENAEKYLLLNDDDKQIGYGYIIDTDINPVELFINEEERSNGYGKLLFEKLLEIIKKSDKKELIFIIKDRDYRMASIVAAYGAERDERLPDAEKYFLLVQKAKRRF